MMKVNYSTTFSERKRCPGGMMRDAAPELILLECKSCGAEVEFFTRQRKSKCGECGGVTTRYVPSCNPDCGLFDRCFPKEN